MRRRLTAALAATAIALSVPIAGTAGATAQQQQQHAAAPIAQAACIHARIGGKRKCIARGQYCARRYERDYERHGFTCSKRDRRGRWHLR